MRCYRRATGRQPSSCVDGREPFALGPKTHRRALLTACTAVARSNHAKTTALRSAPDQPGFPSVVRRSRHVSLCIWDGPHQMSLRHAITILRPSLAVSTRTPCLPSPAICAHETSDWPVFVTESHHGAIVRCHAIAIHHKSTCVQCLRLPHLILGHDAGHSSEPSGVPSIQKQPTTPTVLGFVSNKACESRIGTARSRTSSNRCERTLQTC